MPDNDASTNTKTKPPAAPPCTHDWRQLTLPWNVSNKWWMEVTGGFIYHFYCTKCLDIKITKDK